MAKTATYLTTLAALITIVVFVTGITSISELLDLFGGSNDDPGAPSVDRRVGPAAPPTPGGASASRRKARVECSAKYEQERSRYLNPHTWISQCIILPLREYRGVRAVFDRYVVRLTTDTGSLWVEREFELPGK